MPNQNAAQIKEKIISFINIRGPSLPVHVAKEVNLSMLFASAFLSELFAEKRIKISHMKVGGSPLYFTPNQEPQLERFYQYLNSKEKEAFLLLKEKQFLKDSEQEPAIRVALRFIKDFAIPFKRNEEAYWRYLTVQESEYKEIIKEIKEEKAEEKIEGKIPVPAEKEKELKIFDKVKEKKEKSRKRQKKIKETQDDNFFNKIKNFLSEKLIEITDIENVNRNNLVLRVKEKNKERLIMAYNKKRITEQDILKANKKAKEMNLPYEILSFGEPLKRISSLIEALKDMYSIGKIDQE